MSMSSASRSTSPAPARSAVKNHHRGTEDTEVSCCDPRCSLCLCGEIHRTAAAEYGEELMRFYWPIQKLDHEQHMVWGYASTEAEDEQGEVIRRDALAAALEDYMRFANIREMHQPSAVGIAEEAAIDDKRLYLARHAGDAVA